MYEHILERERKISWTYGNVTCATYPLEHIDTIDINGEINTNSAIYHIVYGVRAIISERDYKRDVPKHKRDIKITI